MADSSMSLWSDGSMLSIASKNSMLSIGSIVTWNGTMFPPPRPNSIRIGFACVGAAEAPHAASPAALTASTAIQRIGRTGAGPKPVSSEGIGRAPQTEGTSRGPA